MQTKILWVDDEIDLLRAHCIYLETKGFSLSTCTNAADALAQAEQEKFDIIFLDENMPGQSGLDVLPQLKHLCPDTPIVMVTKSEEENIMEQAIGSRIADYLIKPVNPSQMLLCIKKHTESRRLVTETTQALYRQQFSSIAMQTMECRTFSQWADLYQKLVRWEIDLEHVKTLDDVHMMQKAEADKGFSRFVRDNYLRWTSQPEQAPLMSNRLLSDRIMPLIDAGHKVVFIVIDNCRLDQWELFRQVLSKDYEISSELYCSILPTSTQYARNAIFSGLMPAQIKQMYPQFWVESDEESSQNRYEPQLLGTYFERYRRRDVQHAYYKVGDAESGNRLVNIFNRYAHNHLNAFVYNFVDMLSHARTDIKMVAELSTDMAAYRSLTLSWFEHSPLYDLLMLLKDTNVKVVITTDHGTIRVGKPIRIIGDREVNTNLRFKTGKRLSYNDKDLFTIDDPARAGLPKSNLTSSYVFATGTSFFVYPNNYNHYVDAYTDTFQHGGISMEEMIIPLAILSPK